MFYVCTVGKFGISFRKKLRTFNNIARYIYAYRRKCIAKRDVPCYNALNRTRLTQKSNIYEANEMVKMSISYNRLWKLLVDKKMSKADLRRAAEISPNTMTKLRRDEEVSMSVLKRICEYLECNISDVCDFVPVPDTEVNP